ncbi:putative oxidoreductase [Novosphingobium kunmingense]|uniref:Putative oxidoreductase n=1 Tax=Novosphingobium kunmingense TaxID=1211806 RepID=A0A2N0HJP7_9SPHN|nr:DoxX family protein [Novosphingobium kunmingense]PKB19174.1 putative oxidoreductase [Novosphingobium kunmingense]
MSTIAAVLGRILIAVIFIVSGAGKLMNPAMFETMITGVGLPSGLAIPAGAFEVLAGLALALGLMTRLTALLLFGFTALATLFFHRDITDPMQQVLALKNLAIMGGLLLVFAHSQMWWSWDRMRTARKGEVATLEAQQRAHEAELRAARAEGRAEVAQTAPVATTDRVVTDVDGDGVPEVRKRRWW